GNIEFMGRIDFQVKIRGFRIELGEIENRLLEHENIKDTVVVAKDDGKDEKYLCAYYVAANKTTVEETLHGETPLFEEFLAQTLPDYMIPAYYVPIEAIPLNPNGKVNLKALPEPGTGMPGVEIIPPGNRLEMKLQEIWSAVLAIDKENIGIDNNFFQLGGHSLTITRLASMIHKELEVNIPLPELFKINTIRSITAYIETAKETKYQSIEPVEKKDNYPLSSAQKRMYILQQRETQSTAYNIFTAALLQGNVDTHRLEKVFTELVNRHESLRTTFEIKDGEPVQVVHDHCEFVLQYGEYTGEIGTLGTTREIKRYIRPFELEKAPLLRVTQVKLNKVTAADEPTNLLIIDMHHIISDGTSVGVLASEFMALYEGKNLQPLGIQYKDYTRWQENKKQGETIKKQEAYWLEQYRGELSATDLPYDYPRPVYPAFAGRQVGFDIGTGATKALKN
ncbi:MAG: non-ribosomal peptide synthetase, partial [bacterium]|nr:non-ribosomal peptide synthetase [bacterium]